MATVTVSDNTQLRSAIQNAAAVDVIELNGASPFSVTTLAKFVSFSPLTPVGGYTVQSASGGKRTLSNTRIYQQNIDGPYAPSNVNNVILNYSNGNTTAIFRATSGTYTFNAIDITGTHGGWTGNGSVYMSMTVSDGLNPINTNLTLSNSTISLTGQSGFNAAAGTGSVSAFMQSWNNSGNVSLTGNTFDESGYKTSFHFASLNSGGALRGNYTIAGNTFKRTSNANVRDRGNRLESVAASVSTNTFQDGSYLALGGTLSSMSLTSNTFSTILGGTGISISSGSVVGTPLLFLNNAFTGYGMALSNLNTAPNSIATFTGSNTVTAGTLSAQTFTQFTAGGSGGNVISVNGANDWINGGAGNDTISSAGGNDYIIGGLGNDTINPGTGADTILYYGTNEGADTITGFLPGTDKLAFRTGGGGATAFTGPLNFLTSAPVAGVATWSYVGGVLSYDADGTGAGSSVTIATFTGSPAITAADLVLF
jgi:Ca2+-binding RTX toxin-like protein